MMKERILRLREKSAPKKETPPPPPEETSSPTGIPE
jgi:hypothetical protein